MANDLGNLSYTLDIDDSKFNQKIDAATRKASTLDKSVTIEVKHDSIGAATAALEILENRIKAVSNIAASITIKANNALGDTTLFDASKINVTDLVSAIKKELDNGVPVKIIANQDNLSTCLNAIRQFFRGKDNKIDILINPTLPENIQKSIKSKIENALSGMKLTNVSIGIGTKKDVQAQIDALSKEHKWTLPLEIKLLTNTLKSQLERIGASINLNNSNLNGGKATVTDGVGKQIVDHNKLNRTLTDQLGIRRAINTQMSTNTQLATMFGNVVGNVFATYQLQRFLEGLIQIGGEIQKQRMALGHILQSNVQADTIFGQMKDLAVKSPFGLLDLMKNARQLSAFGIEYNKLYDTMKRLSDISAGLGIDFGRLSLAFGETMERGFLDGKLVRQFSYMGLPILQKIAEYYTEIGKAGKGVNVSASQVRAMVSDKMVSFQDVEAVIKRLTDANGQFYNMQDVMAESVAGKWKNLKDAIDIMYNDITESNSDILKAPAELLTNLTRNYDSLGLVLMAVGARMMGLKAASAMHATALGGENKALLDNIMAQNKATQAKIRALTIYRNLTQEEQRRLLTLNRITKAQFDELVSSGGLEKSQWMQLISVKALTKEQQRMLIQLGLLTREEVAAATGMSTFGLAVNRAADAFGRFMKANGMLMLLTGVVVLIEKLVSAQKEANRLRDSIDNAIGEKLQTINDVKMHITIDTSDMSADDMQNKIDDLLKSVKDTMPELAKSVNEIFAVDEEGSFVDNDVASRLTRLQNLIVDYKRVVELSKGVDVVDIFKGSQLEDESERFAKAVNEASKRLKQVLKTEWWQELGNIGTFETQGKGNADLVAWLLGDPDQFQSRLNLFFESLKSSIKDDGARQDIQATISEAIFGEQWQEVPDLTLMGYGIKSAVEKMRESITSEMKSIWKDFDINNMTGEQESVLKLKLDAYLENNEASSMVKDWERNNWTKWLKIPLKIEEFNDVSNVFSGWKKDLNDAFGKEFSEEIRSASTYAEAIENIRKKFKSLKESIEQSGGLYTELKIDVVTNLKGNKPINEIPTTDDILKNIPWAVSPTAAKTIVEQQNKVIKEYNAALEGFTKTNTTPKAESLTDKKSKTDTWLTKMKEEFDEIKKTYSEFEKWAAKVGKQNAGAKMKELGLLGAFTEEQLADPNFYEKTIKAFYDKIKKQLNTAQREKFGNSVQVEISNVELKIKEEALKRAAEKAAKEINQAAKQYSLWKDWFNATGDSDLALRMSVAVTPVWDERSDALLKQLESAISGKGIELDWTRNASMIDMEEAFKKADLSDQFEKYKAIYDLIWNAGEEASKALADAVKNLQTSAEKIALIEDKYKRLIETDKNANGGANVVRLTARRNYERLQNESDYALFLKDSMTLTEGAAMQLGAVLKYRLTEMFRAGGMSADQYAKEIQGINKEMDKVRKRNLGSGAFGSKTSNERSTDLYNRGVQEFGRGSRMMEEATAALAKAQQDSNREAIASAKTQQKAATKVMDAGSRMQESAIKQMESAEYLQKAADSLGQMMQGFSQFVNDWEALEKANGQKESDKTAGYVGAIGGSLNKFTSGMAAFANGDIGGVAAGIGGGIASLISGIKGADDAKLQDEIDTLDRMNTNLESIKGHLETLLSKKLGGIYTLEMDSYTRDYLKSYGSGRDDVKSALESGSYYQAQLAMLNLQKENLEKQKQLEIDKKGTDYDKVEDYRKEIEDLQIQIEYFAEDMANALYGIDFKSWASELADSIVGAWQKGENAVEAYKNSVSDMLASVAKSVVSQKIIGAYLEKQIEPWLEQFTAKGGIMDDNLFSGLTNIFTGLEQKVEEGTSFMDAWEKIANSKGFSLKESDKSSSSSTGIKGVSEETASILASYVAGMRLDLSQQVGLVKEIRDAVVSGNNEGDNSIAQSQLTQLRTIATNTGNTVNVLTQMHEDLENIINGTKALHIQ